MKSVRNEDKKILDNIVVMGYKMMIKILLSLI